MLAVSSSTAGTLHRFNRCDECCRLSYVKFPITESTEGRTKSIYLGVVVPLGCGSRSLRANPGASCPDPGRASPAGLRRTELPNRWESRRSPKASSGFGVRAEDPLVG